MNMKQPALRFSKGPVAAIAAALALTVMAAGAGAFNFGDETGSMAEINQVRERFAEPSELTD